MEELYNTLKIELASLEKSIAEGEFYDEPVSVMEKEYDRRQEVKELLTTLETEMVS